MGNDFRLRRGSLRIIAQDFSGAPVQRLPSGFEQAVVGRVLDQRVLEAIARLRRRALDVIEPILKGSSGSIAAV